MTRRTIRAVLFSLLSLVSHATAQFTTVTGTIVDPNGLPYAGGTITAALISTNTPTLNGFTYQPPIQPTGLDLNGKFTLQLADNTQLLPAGSKWTFTVSCGAGCVPPAGGKGAVTFTLAAPITISGASQDISTQLNAAVLALSRSSGGATRLDQITAATNSNTAASSANFNITWPWQLNGATDGLDLTEPAAGSGPTGAMFGITTLTPAAASPGQNGTDLFHLVGAAGGAGSAGNDNGGNAANAVMTFGLGGAKVGSGTVGTNGGLDLKIAGIAGGFLTNYPLLQLENTTLATDATHQNDGPPIYLKHHIWATATPADALECFKMYLPRNANTANPFPNALFTWTNCSNGNSPSTASLGAIAVGQGLALYTSTLGAGGGGVANPSGALTIGGPNATGPNKQNGQINFLGQGVPTSNDHQWDLEISPEAGQLNSSGIGGWRTDSQTNLTAIMGVSRVNGTDTNLAGGNGTIQTGISTGTAFGGLLSITGNLPGTSGTTANPTITRAVFNDVKLNLTNAAANTIASFPIAADQAGGGLVKYSVVAHDTTNHHNCIRTGQVSAAAENSGGVFVATVDTAAGDTTTVACDGAGTLTLSWAITGANPAVLSVTPTLSFSATVTSYFIVYSIESGGDASVTP